MDTKKLDAEIKIGEKKIAKHEAKIAKLEESIAAEREAIKAIQKEMKPYIDAKKEIVEMEAKAAARIEKLFASEKKTEAKPAEPTVEEVIVEPDEKELD